MVVKEEELLMAWWYWSMQAVMVSPLVIDISFRVNLTSIYQSRQSIDSAGFGLTWNRSDPIQNPHPAHVAAAAVIADDRV